MQKMCKTIMNVLKCCQFFPCLFYLANLPSPRHVKNITGRLVYGRDWIFKKTFWKSKNPSHIYDKYAKHFFSFL